MFLSGLSFLYTILDCFLCAQLTKILKIFRKKKKNKAKKVLEDVSHSASKTASEESQKEVPAEDTSDTRTPAQIAYDKIQEKRVCTFFIK